METQQTEDKYRTAIKVWHSLNGGMICLLITLLSKTFLTLFMTVSLIDKITLLVIYLMLVSTAIGCIYAAIKR